MKNLVFTVAVICIFISYCSSQQTEGFEIDDVGITVEKFDSSVKDENRYNLNNRIYKVGRKFSFRYYHQNKNGDHLLMTKGALNDRQTYDWKFEREDRHDDNSVYLIVLTVASGLRPFIEQIPDYNQTVIKYDYIPNKGTPWVNEMTGVIENSKNVWMHPPRMEFFKILEVNPFPYIKTPHSVGNKWDWKLQFGSHWSDPRWLSWRGVHENIYSYQITNKVVLQTKLGELGCFVVESRATSDIGTTKLTSYFNEDYGFVKLDYTNIDSSKTVIEIEKVE